jgi:enoyl-CoA hydratase
MTYTNLLFEADAGIAQVTVNRPDKLNALNRAVMDELEDAFGRVQADSSARALIVTGAGGKAFVAGADIGELAEMTPLEFRARCARDQAILRRLETLGKPSLAALNGYALGGGLELAMACTLRVAARQARLGQPEVKLGILPGNGGTQRLPRLVGRGRALEMLLSGKPITAEEAHRIGLVNHVVEGGDLLAFCRGLLAPMLENSPLAQALILEAVDTGLSMGLEEALRFETGAISIAAAAEDRLEGTRAFLEKRKPVFAGR